ncbi:MAG: hypothetical protein ACRC8Q_02055, partial [Aeromonas sp.]
IIGHMSEYRANVYGVRSFNRHHRSITDLILHIKIISNLRTKTTQVSRPHHVIITRNSKKDKALRHLHPPIYSLSGIAVSPAIQPFHYLRFDELKHLLCTGLLLGGIWHTALFLLNPAAALMKILYTVQGLKLSTTYK